jgi:uncharacterized protein YndB with AHSA1/START domain
MLDASFIILSKTERSVAFIREWLYYCGQGQLLTDHPNIYGLPNLPGFIAHRHDQSILTILANRAGIEGFRHPSQYGNHLKDVPYREPGEWTRFPYGYKGIYYNSPYKTLLNHHRGELGRSDCRVCLSRVVAAPQREVFYYWTEQEKLKKWLGAASYITVKAETDLRVGGKYYFKIMDPIYGRTDELTGMYFEVRPPLRLVFSWRWKTRVTVDLRNRGDSTNLVLTHEYFPDDKLRDQHAALWSAALDKLSDVLCRVLPPAT